MAFVPKSHKHEFVEHEVNDEKLLQVTKKPDNFVKCELQPGKENPKAYLILKTQVMPHFMQAEHYTLHLETRLAGQDAHMQVKFISKGKIELVVIVNCRPATMIQYERDNGFDHGKTIR